MSRTDSTFEPPPRHLLAGFTGVNQAEDDTDFYDFGFRIHRDRVPDILRLIADQMT